MGTCQKLAEKNGVIVFGLTDTDRIGYRLTAQVKVTARRTSDQVLLWLSASKETKAVFTEGTVPIRTVPSLG